MGPFFQPVHLEMLGNAVALSEEIISDSFGLTTDYWLKNPFEVKTLRDEAHEEVPKGVYAHLKKYGNNWWEKFCGRDTRCLYKIIVLDPRVLETTGGEPPVMMPFFLYIMTHELIHMVRFARFECAATIKDKTEEEKRVHLLTEKVLEKVKIPNLDLVIDFFNGKKIKLCMN